MSSEDFRKAFAQDRREIDYTLSEAKRGRDETARVEAILQNTPQILDDLDVEFCKRTKLEPLDVSVMFVAIGLQIARQYLLTKFPDRLDDQTAAETTKGHSEEHSNRQHRLYNPSLKEIITNPVPFDANIGANGALRGGGRLGHRAMTIGHDPILGLIFGTANIATSTLTTANFDSYHIYTNDRGRDFFKNHARTDLVISYTIRKLLDEGIDGKIIVGASLAKEIIHLRSDLNTKNSLPLPIVAVIDAQFASRLASYGFDMANVATVGKQASLAMLRYLSHSACTCGLHIHVSRRAFGDSSNEQDAAIARVLFFVERHWNELLRFSRRTQRQLDQWAARYGYKDHPQEMMEHVKKGYANRYTCVNLTNDNTIEFRIFRGTLKYNTLIATLQLVKLPSGALLKITVITLCSPLSAK